MSKLLEMGIAFLVFIWFNSSHSRKFERWSDERKTPDARCRHHGELTKAVERIGQRCSARHGNTGLDAVKVTRQTHGAIVSSECVNRG